MKSNELGELLKPLDEMSTDILDNVVTAVDAVYKQFMNNEQCNMKLLGILETLGNTCAGFTYSICKDINNNVTGFVWMTSVMRYNFLHYSTFICMDAMKKKTNVNLWPYMSIVVQDENGLVQVCCEALMTSERHDAYKFMLKSAFQMAPSFDNRNIHAVYGDEFLTPDLFNSIAVKLF